MSENEEAKNQKREIQVVNGDGTDLEISPVYDHIKSSNTPSNDKKKKDIVIPKGSSDKKINKKVLKFRFVLDFRTFLFLFYIYWNNYVKLLVICPS